MLDLQGCAERVKLERAGRGPFAQTKESVGELLAIVGENSADADGACKFEVTQKPACIGGGLGREDADEYPGVALSIATKR